MVEVPVASDLNLNSASETAPQNLVSHLRLMPLDADKLISTLRVHDKEGIHDRPRASHPRSIDPHSGNERHGDMYNKVLAELCNRHKM